MRIIFSICLFLLFGFQSNGQERHFILIQTDNKQIFNVSLGGKLYSSNISGYVIIPKLNDGDYNIVIGFPPNTFPDQPFKCLVDKKDLGFQLKNFGEKGWALFNLQSMEVTYAGGSTAGKVAAPPVADEPISFDKKPVPPVAITTTDTGTTKTYEAPSPRQDSIVYTTNDANTPASDTSINVSQNTREIDAGNGPRAITKVGEEKDSVGVNLAYTDANGTKADTIQITIPTAPQSADTAAKLSYNDSIIAAKIAQLNQRKDDVKVLEIDMNAPKTDSTVVAALSNDTTVTGNAAKVDIVEEKPVVKTKSRKKKKQEARVSPSENETPVEAKTNENIPQQVSSDKDKVSSQADEIAKANVVTPSVNAAPVEVPVVDAATPKVVASKKTDDLCSDIATENDYMKLRRRMALESSDDRMIREAKKSYKDKCFTTRQVKGLSSLFLSDEGRFKFFTASYSFVSDPEAYAALQSEFIDPFYVNRFKSIVQ